MSKQKVIFYQAIVLSLPFGKNSDFKLLLCPTLITVCLSNFLKNQQFSINL